MTVNFTEIFGAFLWFLIIIYTLKMFTKLVLFSRGLTNSDRSNSSQSSSSSSSSSKESVDLLQELTNEMRIAVAEAEQEVYSILVIIYKLLVV